MERLSTSEMRWVLAPGLATPGVRGVRGCAQVLLAVAVLMSASVAGAAPEASARVGEPPAARVDGVVMPAWLERSGLRQPIFAGMALQEHDRIETGAKARIELSLPEGSKVRLGEHAQLGLETLRVKRDGGSVFLQSALRVVVGAFRFTTSALSKASNRRDVNIRFATVTAGIRGTDVWGKQSDTKEIVCLLEGKIEVARDMVAGQSSAPITMDQPLQFYIAPKDQPALPIGRVADAQLAEWAAETAIAANTGAAAVGGLWKITFDRDTSFAGALALHAELRKLGYPAEFVPDKKDGQRIYIVQLGQLSSEADARALAARMAHIGSTLPKVGR